MLYSLDPTYVIKSHVFFIELNHLNGGLLDYRNDVDLVVSHMHWIAAE